jgi:hypothetical protein
MMLKLYQRSGKKIFYWETWDDGRKLVIHWGTLGTRGKTKTVRISGSTSTRKAIAAHSEKPKKEGYAEIDLEDHAQIVVQYRTETWGNVDDLDKRNRVEGILNECLGWTGNGHCDGGDIGSGSINTFSFVVDPKLAGETIVKALRKEQLLDGAVIAYAKPGEDDHTVVWPKNFRGEFSIV